MDGGTREIKKKIFFFKYAFEPLVNIQLVTPAQSWSNAPFLLHLLALHCKFGGDGTPD